MSKLAQALDGGKFVLTVELDPPRGSDLKPLTELTSSLGGKADALVISDNRGAVARMSPVLACHHLIKHASAEVIMTLACRDRNRLALASEMLAAAAGGVENLLVVSGDFTTLGDQPGAQPVFDLDSVQTLQLAASLEEAAFFLGAVLAPDSTLMGMQALKLRKKVQAGAAFFITKPISNGEGLGALLAQAGGEAPRVLAGLELGPEEDPAWAVELARELKAQGQAAGVHLSCPENQARLPELAGQLAL
ncbi:MAG: methylenetetrahydrofolate reductase [Desulfarculaceae bacterium]|nr:methylenetetrahydrofolate reductase [Desulfarculaceae bacterium]MCF8073027.1 methylenetetrahydrofolate reductase [Desulfarculaceae bacterium]MCF8101888.1 methylenetetrahydrofolate reductase [Desulfarculaceae bacterium]MCF8115415.1 methylenetetrahydrofolate reductase [Desulfarculaceae bacterium]